MAEVKAAAVSTILIELKPAYCFALIKENTQDKSTLIQFGNKLGIFSKHYINVSNE
jgi:hypothetical protein